MTYLNHIRVVHTLPTRQAMHIQSAPYRKHYHAPVLLVSQQRLRQNAQRFIAAMPRVRPHYAVKANPDPKILSIFQQQGTCFEVASKAEVKALLDLKIDLREVLYSNPIKSPEAIYYAAAQGIIWYTVDSLQEIEKIAAIKPDAKLCLRIEVSNEGASWPLMDKFGASEQEIPAILAYARDQNMQLHGITFHVGSQCTHTENWLEGIQAAKGLFAQFPQFGFTPELLNLGGGYPVPYTGHEPTIQAIGQTIHHALRDLPESIRVVAEPGRSLVSSAAFLVTQVIGLATRKEAHWAYLDAGFYNGLMELSQGFPSLVISERQGLMQAWTLAGPTCDSIDVMGQHSLPCDTAVGDFMYIANMGAYSTACACEFNGFPALNLQMIP